MNRPSLLPFLCLVSLCASPGIHAEVLNLSTGERTATSVPAPPDKKVEKGDNWISVTYTFSEAALMEDADFPGTFLWKYPGFGNTLTEGKPAIPCRADRFIIPEGCTANVEITNSVYKDFQIELAPSGKLEYSASTSASDNIVSPITPYNGLFPETLIDGSEINEYRGTEFLWVKTSPVQYNYNDKSVRAYSEVSYKITFEYDGENSVTASRYIACNDAIYNTAEKLDSEDDYPVSMQTLIGDGIVTPIYPFFQFEGHLNQAYLIITTTPFRSVAQKLAEWKKHMGFNVYIETEDSWTNESVKERIQDYYDNYSIYYVLFIGDNKIIPSYAISKYNSKLTDLSYYCLGGVSDNYPDVYGGRIPVDNQEDALTVINKTILYEQSPPNDERYLSTAVLAARFQDDKLDGYEDRRFTLTTEEIARYISDKYSNIKRFYSLPPGCIPTHWNNGIYSYGEEIFEELKPENFKWESNQDTICNEINKGCSLMYYNGHGAHHGWWDPYFLTEHIYKLKNKNKYPIYLGITCSTGIYDCEDGFVRNLLSLKDAGCVAGVAATEDSYSYENDMFAQGMINALWPTPGIYPDLPNKNFTPEQNLTPVYTLGEIMFAGLLRMDEMYGRHDEWQWKVYHCFGDPSLRTYWRTYDYGPISPTVNPSNNTWTYKLKEKAFISVYDSSTRSSHRFFHDHLTFSAPDMNTTSIYVAYPGCPLKQIMGDEFVASEPYPEITKCYMSGNNVIVKIVNQEYVKSSMRIEIRDLDGVIVSTEPIVANVAEYSIDASMEEEGYNVAAIVYNGNIISSKLFVK